MKSLINVFITQDITFLVCGIIDYIRLSRGWALGKDVMLTLLENETFFWSCRK